MKLIARLILRYQVVFNKKRNHAVVQQPLKIVPHIGRSETSL